MPSSMIPGIANPNTTKFSHGAQPKFILAFFENAMSKGEVAQWSDTTAYLGFGVEDAVNSSTRVAGVVPVAVSTANTWGWLQAGGYCDYITTDGSVAAPNADTLQGDVYLQASNNSSAPRAIGVTNVESMGAADNSAGLIHSCFAMNLAADTSGNLGYCILMCRYQH